MREMGFSRAIDDAIAQAMARDDSIVIIGEDVHSIRVDLFSRFGKDRVLSAPISEASFVGAGVTAAMAGLKPIVEVMLVDFIGVAMDAVMNHAAKVLDFSGGDWHVPLVIRTTCGGGYGDAGQHEQSLWGMLAHVPGLSVVVPSNPADAGQLMTTCIEMKDPVIFLEHKLLSENWLAFLGSGGRETVSFDVPSSGARGPVPDRWEPLPVGELSVVKEGNDVTIASLGVGTHRAMEASESLAKEGIDAEVLDLRWVAPLDVNGLARSVEKTGKLVIVDEDYKANGLSGEACAALVERDMEFTFRRVCTESTIPFSREMEDQVLPNVERIVAAAKELLK